VKLLAPIVLQQTTLDDAIGSGSVQIDGSRARLDEMLSYLDNFEFWFDIVTPKAHRLLFSLAR